MSKFITDTAAEPATETVTQTRTRCRHIHAAGHQCGSPALRKRSFCYYHDAAHRPYPNPRSYRQPEHNLQSFSLPIIKDHRSVLLALSQVAARIAANDLDVKRAHLLLEALRIASTALARESRLNQPKRLMPQPSTQRPDARTTNPSPSPRADAEAPIQPVVHDPIFDPAWGPLAPESTCIDPHPAEGEEPAHSASPTANPATRDPNYPFTGIFAIRTGPAATQNPTAKTTSTIPSSSHEPCRSRPHTQPPSPPHHQADQAPVTHYTEAAKLALGDPLSVRILRTQEMRTNKDL